MTDVFSARKRSEVMAAIKGRGNLSTEQAVKQMLRRHRLHGWRSHSTDVFGRPDISFKGRRVAIFADGCFWHGCRKCGLRGRASTNRQFWLDKISRNLRRDRLVTRTLRARGWQVIRLWEHDIEKRPEHCLTRIRRLLEDRHAG